MRTGLLSQVNHGGLSMIVAAVGDRGMPSCCRAVGARANDDGETMTVWVPVATSNTVVTNLASNPRVAVVVSAPITHETIQVKGVSHAVRLAPLDDKEIIIGQMDKLADVLDQLGLPRRVTSRINRWPVFAIDLTIAEVYDQTPGPKAGRMVR